MTISPLKLSTGSFVLIIIYVLISTSTTSLIPPMIARHIIYKRYVLPP
jgi:hypothetical protein